MKAKGSTAWPLLVRFHLHVRRAYDQRELHERWRSDHVCLSGVHGADTRLLRAVLSSTTTASAFSVSRLSVSSELYGCTTTSLVSAWLGNTLRTGQRTVSCTGGIAVMSCGVCRVARWPAA